MVYHFTVKRAEGFKDDHVNLVTNIFTDAIIRRFEVDNDWMFLSLTDGRGNEGYVKVDAAKYNELLDTWGKVLIEYDFKTNKYKIY